jgi:hypothetical protein
MNLNDREDLRELRSRVETALSGLGLNVKLGPMRFDSNGNFVKFGVEMYAGRSQADMDLEAAILQYHLNFVGVVKGLGECELVGYNRRARKYPFIVRCGEKEYKLGLDATLEGFGGAQ